MNKKLINRINGGMAIYYGIGCVIAAIGGVIAMGIVSFRALTGSGVFSWGAFGMMTALTAIVGLIGYVLLRVGYEEVEK